MKGRALVAFFLASLPSLARAQRFEVAVFLGGSQAIPTSWESEGNRENCQPVAAPCEASAIRKAGSLVGGRLTVDISPRVAFAWNVHVTRATTLVELNDGSGALSTTPVEVTDVVLALQPMVRFPIRTSFELLAGAGPAFSELDDQSRMGIAFTGGASLRIGTAFKAQFQAGYATYLPRNVDEGIPFAESPESSPDGLNDVTWSFGIAYAFGARGQ